ncbi:hypothetical protein BCR33DRAFT_764050 [Rhizoclosmatium globosum]|uniref:Uncharacterized protein n=1 Tax=Rhizoclosmatium globosum TaxID=329046 RepID=A0A1Y2CKT5_9FUNG|nr:hypothetical protein BCR33DRAFT_764050 [Rhizoclosmatium globosum]|eukprot:ORY47629.1 hypothetical protein BCR33DRAFT_764050 [Rhizoclosmatium globosum]
MLLSILLTALPGALSLHPNNGVSLSVRAPTSIGCYPTYNTGSTYPTQSLATLVNPKDATKNYVIQKDAYGIWNSKSLCDATITQSCFPNTVASVTSPVVGSQAVGSSNVNYVWNGSVWVSAGACIVYAKPPSVLNYLAGVAPDNTFLSKPCLTCAWNTLTNPTKATDLVQMPDNSLIVLGLDKTLYTCATLTVWDTCKNVPNSGAALSIDLLGDGTTLIGVGTDNQLYTRAGLSGAWVLVSGSGTVVDVTVLANGALLGTAPDGTLYKKTTLSSTWTLVPNSCCVIRTAQSPEGSILGVGPDNAVYQKVTLDSPWVILPNSKTVISAVPTSIQQYWTPSVIGVGTDNKLFAKGKDSISGPWVPIPGVTAIDLFYWVNNGIIVVTPSNSLLNCPTFSATGSNACTVIPTTGAVIGLKSVTKLGDISTLVGVGSDNRLYTRNGLISDAWTLVPNSGYVVDITFLEGGILLGTGVDGKLLTKQSLTAPWVTVANSCCVYHTVQFYDGSILGVGTDNAIYQRKTVSDPWVLLPNTQTVTSVAWAYLK